MNGGIGVCGDEFQTARPAEENKSTRGMEEGELTHWKWDSLDTICCFAVAIEVFWNNQSVLIISWLAVTMLPAAFACHTS